MAEKIPNNFIRVSKGQVEARLDVLFYSEEGVYYAFAPALDLLGYGLSQDEAKKSFEIVFQEYVRYGIEKNTLDEDLHKHGWTNQGRRFSSPGFVVVLQNNKQVQKVVEQDYAKASERFAYSIC